MRATEKSILYKLKLIKGTVARPFNFWKWGGKAIELPAGLKVLLGVAALAAILAGTYAYAGNKALFKLSGILLLSAALGYVFQRGRWCMIQGFREPFMTGDCEIAKSVALSIACLATGIAIIKMLGVRPAAEYVRGDFGWGGIMGGVIFGFGALLAGGCGTGTLWRMGEGYRPMPILFNEDDHFNFDQPDNNMLAALSEYASWGFFDYRMADEGFAEGYQSVPVDWSIHSERKRGFFNLLKTVTGY